MLLIRRRGRARGGGDYFHDNEAMKRASMIGLGKSR